MRKAFANKNVFVVSLTSSISMFFNMLYWPYWPAYLQEVIGLSIPQIGLLQALQRSNQLLFTFPGGLLADRIGRKKVTLMGAAVQIATPLIYIFAGNWELVLIGTVVNATQSISTAAFTAMIAESMSRGQRGTGYGVYGMMRRVPLVFTGIMGGWLMDTMTLAGGMHICFVGGVIGGVIVFVGRYFFLTETLKKKPGPQQSVKEDFKEVIPLFQGSLKYMQITSALYQFAMGLTMNLIVIYLTGPKSEGYLGFTYTEYGVISTVMSVVGLITALPGGMMADKYNRVTLNVWARCISPITTMAYIYLRDYYQVLATRVVAGVGMGLSGVEVGMIGGPSMDSLMADLVPPEKRGRFTGLMSTFSGIVSFPSPYIGGYMWIIPGVGPEGAMWAGLIIGLASTFIFGKFVKDPRYEKKAETVEAEEEEGDGEEEERKERGGDNEKKGTEN
jgi:MFS family permease